MACPQSELPAILAGARAIFVDWDGCLAQDGRLLPGAAEFLDRTAPRSFILSNNSTDLPEDFQAFLAGEGVHIPTGRILLAGHQTIGYIAGNHEGRRIHLIANARLTAYARALGMNVTSSEPELVVLLRDTAFSYETLQTAANSIRSGAQLVVANPDLTHPAAGGAVVPETGALLAALWACVNLTADDIEIIGKPSGHLFEFALSRADAAPEETLMVGDNPITDIAGAQRCGIRAILLEHGKLSIADLARAAAPSLTQVAEQPLPQVAEQRRWI